MEIKTTRVYQVNNILVVAKNEIEAAKIYNENFKDTYKNIIENIRLILPENGMCSVALFSLKNILFEEEDNQKEDNKDYKNDFKTCTSLKESPIIPKDILEKNRISIEEMIEVYKKIEKDRIEDNLNFIQKFLRKVFKIK